MSELKEKLKKIAKEYSLAEIYVFGSRAKEVAARVEGVKVPLDQLVADVDIGVRPKKGRVLSARDKVSIIIELEDLFDAPRVDLVLLPEAEAFLALEIIRGELLYCEDADAQAWYELYVLRRAGDLLPLKKERIRMIFQEGAK